MIIDQQRTIEGRLFGEEVLRAIVRRIWFVVLLPLVVGLIAGGFSLTLKRSYTSEAYLGVNAIDARNMEVMLRSPVVLDAVLAKFPEDAQSIEAQRELLERKIDYSVARGGRRDDGSLYVVSITDKTPERAQAVLSLMLDTWFETTKPRTDLTAILQEKIARSTAEVEMLGKLIDRLQAESPTLVHPGLEYDLATPLAQLLKMKSDKEETLLELRTQIRGASRDLLLKPPSLPTRPSNIAAAILAGVIGGLATLALLLFVLLSGVLWRHVRRLALLSPDETSTAA